MSVPEGQRSKGKLAIETETEKLLQYIFDVTTKYYLPPENAEDKKTTHDKITEFANARWFADHMRSEICVRLPVPDICFSCCVLADVAPKLQVAGTVCH